MRTGRHLKTSEMTLLDLPEEIILHILRNIPKRDVVKCVAQVCKTLNNLAFESSLWRRLELKEFSLDNTVHLKLLKKISGYVEKITITIGQQKNLHIINSKSIIFSKLKSVHIATCLTDLDIQNIRTFLSKYPDLDHISLTGSYLDIIAVIQTLSSCSKLKSLSLTFDDENQENECCLDSLVIFMLQNKSLTSVSINCENLSDDVARCLLSNDEMNLQTLCWDNCSRITHDTFVGIPTLISLVSLSMDYTGADDNALETIATQCPRLQVLSVEGCALVTDIGFSYVASYCGQLRDVIVNRQEMHSPDGRNITDNGLMSLAQGCALLRRLVVNKCPGVSGMGIFNIAKHCVHLEEIQVAACLSVTDVGITALAENCPYLRIVNLNSCLQITSDSVNKLLVSCKHLRTLRLETCRFLSKLQFDGILPSQQNTSEHKPDPPLLVHPLATDEGKNSGVHSHLSGNNGIKSTVNQNRSNVILDSTLKQSTQNKVDGHTLIAAIQSTKRTVSSDWSAIQDPRNAAFTDTVDTHYTAKPPISTEQIHIPRQATTQHSLSNATSQNNVTTPGPENSLSQDLKSTNIHISPKVPEVTYCISPHHSHLRVLHFAFSSTLTDSGLRQVAKHCPDLTELSIRGCHSICDSSVKTILQRCRFIEILDISGGSAVKATSLTDDCLFAIAQFGLHIRKLYMMKNDLISSDAVRIVLLKCRLLRTIHLSSGRNSDISMEGLNSIAKELQRGIKIWTESRGTAKGTIIIRCRKHM